MAMTAAMVLQARTWTTDADTDIAFPHVSVYWGGRELSKTGFRQQLLSKVDAGETTASRRLAAPFQVVLIYLKSTRLSYEHLSRRALWVVCHGIRGNHLHSGRSCAGLADAEVARFKALVAQQL